MQQCYFFLNDLRRSLHAVSLVVLVELSVCDLALGLCHGSMCVNCHIPSASLAWGDLSDLQSMHCKYHMHVHLLHTILCMLSPLPKLHGHACMFLAYMPMLRALHFTCTLE